MNSSVTPTLNAMYGKGRLGRRRVVSHDYHCYRRILYEVVYELLYGWLLIMSMLWGIDYIVG
jgi:hypothetical protein